MKTLLAALALFMAIAAPALAGDHNRHHGRGHRDEASLKFRIGKTRVELGLGSRDCDRYRYQPIQQTIYVCSRCHAQYSQGHRCGSDGYGSYPSQQYSYQYQSNGNGLYYNSQYGCYMYPGESYEQYYMRSTGTLPPGYQQQRPVYVQPAPGQPVYVQPPQQRPVYAEPVVYGTLGGGPSHHCSKCGGNHSGGCR